MPKKNQVSKALSLVLPAGPLGASLLLALSSAQAATPPADTATDRPSVAARLHAIRAGIADIGAPATQGSAKLEQTGGGHLIPTWWGNGGWGRWHPGWGNGGWRGGWHNGGWGPGWGNGGWPNWHNGWNNWHNGWSNFWHNA